MTGFLVGATPFERRIDGLGVLALRPLHLPEDAATIHAWVTRDYARYWNMGDKACDEIAEFYARMDASDHEAVLIGTFGERPSFLIEVYDPAHHELARHYRVLQGDRGMHVLVAPVDTPIAGFTRAVFRTLMDFLFADQSVNRVVVEPDVRNTKIHALNERFGFVRERDIELEDKSAALSFCTRERYRMVTTDREEAA